MKFVVNGFDFFVELPSLSFDDDEFFVDQFHFERNLVNFKVVLILNLFLVFIIVLENVSGDKPFLFLFAEDEVT